MHASSRLWARAVRCVSFLLLMAPIQAAWALSSISGQVTGPGGIPLEGILARAWIQDGPYSYSTTEEAYTDASGNYSVTGLEAGTYRMEFRDYGGAYASEFYDDVYDLWDGTDIAVGENSAVTGIHAELAEGTSISGRVTDENDNPLEDIFASCYRYDNGFWNQLGYTWTDTNGEYTISGIPEDAYIVRFRDWNEVYGTIYYDGRLSEDSADLISPLAGMPATGIDAVMSSAGSIAGTVTEPDGITPVENVWVHVYVAADGSMAGSDNTDASGAYTINGLGAGTYLVYFSDHGEFIGEWYENAPNQGSATPVVVLAGQATSGIDGSLNMGVGISGTVTAESGGGLAGIQVRFFFAPQYSGYFSTYTESDGTYQKSGIPSGDYKIEFYDVENQRYQREWWNNKSTIGNADIVTLGGSSIPGIDAALARGTVIAGYVEDINGIPLQDIYVQASRQNGINWEHAGSVRTKEDGTYAIGDLSAGTYVIYFADFNGTYLYQYYDGVDSLPAATQLVLTNQQWMESINAVMLEAANVGIAGQVTSEATGLPLQGVYVSAYQYDGVNWGYVDGQSVDENGQYVIKPLHPGAYKVEFNSSSSQYYSEYYNSKTNLETADDVMVLPDQLTTGIDAALATDYSGSIQLSSYDVYVVEGGSASFGVKLSRAPLGVVTVTVSRVDGDEDLNVQSGATLLFNPSNWNVYKNVTLTAAEDGDSFDNHAAFMCSSEDPLWDPAYLYAYEEDNDVDDMSLGAAVEAPQYDWSTVGGQWFVQNEVTYDGVDAVQSGPVGPSGSSILSTYVTGPGELRFYWRIDATDSALHLKQDGSTTATLMPSQIGWFTQSLTIASGEHQVEWAFVRGSSGTTSGRMAGFVDRVAFTFSGKRVVASAYQISIPEGGTTNLGVRLSEAPSGVVTVQVLKVSGDPDISVSSGSPLYFDAGNWNTYQFAVLAAANDSDMESGGALIYCVNPGGNYAGSYVTADEAEATMGQPPVINVTNENVLVDYRVTSVTVGGTVDESAEGLLVWTNSAGGAGSLPVALSWSFEAPLHVGDNTIAVKATNAWGSATDLVVVARGGAGMPTVAATSSVPILRYSVTNQWIGGTNNEHVVEAMSWTNQLGGAGVMPAGVTWSAFVTGLSVGTNRIVVKGTNMVGQFSSVTTTVVRGGLGTDLPYVDITNAAVTVPFETGSVGIGGTNNLHVMGTMRWTNSLGGSGSLEASTSWQVSGIALSVGTNRISVWGTNLWNESFTDAVSVVRNPTLPPVVDITNASALVRYSVTQYTISGTNNAYAVGTMSWQNSLGGSGTFGASSRWQAVIGGLSVGTNTISVTVTNLSGQFATDTVAVVRGGIGTDLPSIDALTTNAFVATTTSGLAITGRASIHVMGFITWTNTRGGGGVIAAATNWVIPSAPLSAGTNLLVVTGTNYWSESASDTVIVVRAGAEPPTIVVTGGQTTVRYSVTSRDLSGTNNLHVAGRMGWTKNTGGSGDLSATRTWQFSVTGLAVGTNLVTITGTNLVGVSCAATAVVVRGGIGTDLPVVTITNPPVVVDFAVSNIAIGGTANEHALGHFKWRNHRIGMMFTNAIPAAQAWQIGSVPLLVGTNIITVMGSNLWSEVGTSAVAITRSPPPPGILSVDIVEPNGGVSCTIYNGAVLLRGVMRSTLHPLSYAGVSGPFGFTGAMTYLDPGQTSGWWEAFLLLPPGSQTITATVYDVWGYAATDTITFNHDDSGLPADFNLLPTGGVYVANMRVNGSLPPLTLPDTNPKYSWNYYDELEAYWFGPYPQAGYRIQVAANTNDLLAGVNLFWDSGIVHSPDSGDGINTIAQAPAFTANGEYCFRVKPYSSSGYQGAWSAIRRFTYTQFPDLQVTGLTAPPSIQYGSTVSVSWVVSNIGGAQVGAQWSDRLFLSTSPTNLAGASHLASVPAPVLLADGQSYTSTVSVSAPLTVQALTGTFHLVAWSDVFNEVNESAETNNRATAQVTMTLPPRPDLVPVHIGVPLSAFPGENFEVVWTVSNSSATVVLGTYRDRLSLSDDNGPVASLSGWSFAYDLEAWSSVVRTQVVAIPVAGPAGSFRIVVDVDDLGELVEADETNNRLTASAQLTVPLALSLACSITSITENSSYPQIPLTITRNGSLQSALSISLVSSDPAELSVTGPVVFASGQGQRVIHAILQADGIYDPDENVHIVASAPSYVSSTARITIVNSDYPSLALSVPTNRAAEGEVITGRVERAGTLERELLVSLENSTPDQAYVAANVRIPAGESDADFGIALYDDNLIEGDVTFSLAVGAPGYLPDIEDVTVIDNDDPHVVLTVTPSTASEGAGSAGALGRVTRSALGSREVVIRLSSTDTTLFNVPPSVTIPAGSTSSYFNVNMVDNEWVDGARSGQVRAWILSSSGQQALRELPPAPLTVTDDDGPALTLRSVDDVVGEGLATATVFVLRRNFGVDDEVVAYLSSSDESELTAPASVVFPTGSQTVEFAVETPEDHVEDGNQDVAVMATAPGYAPASAVITVTDADLPDLVVRNVEGPMAAYSGDPMNLSFVVVNQGRVTAGTNVSVHVYASADNVMGGDVIVRQIPIREALPPGQQVAQAIQFPAPMSVGPVWHVITVDPLDKIKELVEWNNSSIVSQDTYVAASYTAMVYSAVIRAPAGTTIPLYGHANMVESGAPASGKDIIIHVVVNGLRRTIRTATDASGMFSSQFIPLPLEAGEYDIAAAHPGEAAPTSQLHLELLGMKASAMPFVRLAEESSTSNQVVISNLGSVPISGLTISVVSNPPATSIQAALESATLAGHGSLNLTCSIAAQAGAKGYQRGRIRVESDEGVTLDIDVPFEVLSLRPHLTSYPAILESAMVRGSFNMAYLVVTNTGGIDSGPVQVLAPSAPWMTISSASVISNLAPGQGAVVNIQLLPPADMPLGNYSGHLMLSATGASTLVEFRFACQSEKTGHLQIEAVDEYTYYAAGAPRVSNALVRITDPASGSLLVATNTGPDGMVVLQDLNERPYRIEITEPDHGRYTHELLLVAGRTNRITAFMARSAVRYVWRVEPILVEDRTKITIETIFETAVPMPVVTIDPMVIDASQFTNEYSQIEITISNHGLIDAENMEFNFGEFPGYEFTPLVRDVGKLRANSSVTIPVMVHRLPASRQTRRPGILACAVANYGALWELICGPLPAQKRGAQGSFVDLAEKCGVGVGIGGWHDPGTGSAPGPYWFDGIFADDKPITAGESSKACDPCVLEAGANTMLCMAEAGIMAAGALFGGAAGAAGAAAILTAVDMIGCAKNSFDCGKSLVQLMEADEPSPLEGVVAAAGCIKGIAECGGKRIMRRVTIMWTWMSCAKDITDPCNKGAQKSGRMISVAGVRALPGEDLTAGQQVVLMQMDRLNRLIAPLTNIFANNSWYDCEDEAPITNWMYYFDFVTSEETEDNVSISADERSLLLSLPLCGNITAADVDQFIDRWNRSMEYYGLGIFEESDVPAGWSADFILPGQLGQSYIDASAAADELYAEGYTNIVDAIRQAYTDLMNELSGDEGAVCAKVKLRLDQEAVQTRDAFRATLDLANDTENALSNVYAEIRVYGRDGVDATERFLIRPPELTGLASLDGNGSVGAASTGSVAWIIIPTDDAAPQLAAGYDVAGELIYYENGVRILVPLAPTAISVYPNASLSLRYFHQRDVYADDPFTDEVEPSVPFTLAVMVQNSGYGVARNMRITSAQPVIVDNEKGLAVDFRIIGTEVSGQSVSPSLTVELGDIFPNQTRIGRWLLTSTLQGLFTDYDATFEHLDTFSDKRVSIIDDVSIHELIRLVSADRSWDDGAPDFLVNDVVDVRDYPDTLWMSDGSHHPVAQATSMTHNGTAGPSKPSVSMTVIVSVGWTYLRVQNPAPSTYTLASVERADTSEVPAENFWITDRTFVGVGKRPVRETILHLLDYNYGAGPASYTLHYAVGDDAEDLTAPTSSVHYLAASVAAVFPVVWQGTDNPGGSGLTGYDIYVSDNGGPFLKWLTNTPSHGALFSGVFGHTYGFYSVATDAAGNREAVPAGADAVTLVDQSNQVPRFNAVADISVVEGALVLAQISAVDTDAPPQSVTYEWVSRPVGATLDPASGAITWSTGEAQGPGSYLFAVRAMDSGVPQASAETEFFVHVEESNTAPVLAALSNRTIMSSDTLDIECRATDDDLPTQALAFSLIQAPVGAAIHPSTGQLQWTPQSYHAGLSHDFVVRVADNGPGGLSATQSFAVTVVGKLTLAVGSTIVEGGQDGQVALDAMGAGVSAMSFTITAGHAISNWSIGSFGPNVGGATVIQPTPDTLFVVVNTPAGAALPSSERLGFLTFSTPVVDDTADVPLILSGIDAQMTSGSPVASNQLSHGRVTIVGQRPELDLFRSGNAFSVNVLGLPGQMYWLESSTNIMGGWKPLWVGSLSNYVHSIGPFEKDNTLYIFRVRR